VPDLTPEEFEAEQERKAQVDLVAPVTNLRLVSRGTYVRESVLKNIFLLCAFVAVMGVGLIFVFVGLRGWPIFAQEGVLNFLGGAEWNPTEGAYGIFPLIFGSVVVMLGALALGTPLAVGTAVFLSEIASPRVRAVVRPAVELLAGIPSVIYGFFGLIILRPIIAQTSEGLGFGAVTAWFILAIMIVPTIATLSEDALRSLPNGIREASYSMGATTWQTIYKVLLPAAKIGIIDAIILGMGRAIGETMAVLMVVGNAPIIPAAVAEPIATLTTQIVMDMPYASGDHRTALFGMAIILFIFSMGLVALVRLLSRFQSGVETRH
jgi:phosphate transport system permease protein